MTISEFQTVIRGTYLKKDRTRGLAGTLAWFHEEVGELTRALRKGSREEILHEFSDVFAWLASLANLSDVELEEAAKRYALGCPRCSESPCRCPERGITRED
jgi:NTP pyrophosphatase (non-canonical NTP hydrolase)